MFPMTERQEIEIMISILSRPANILIILLVTYLVTHVTYDIDFLSILMHLFNEYSTERHLNEHKDVKTVVNRDGKRNKNK